MRSNSVDFDMKFVGILRSCKSGCTALPGVSASRAQNVDSDMEFIGILRSCKKAGVGHCMFLLGSR